MKMKKGAKLGHYEILSPIGKGGMGEVFLAKDTKLERRVALKILPPEFAADSDRMSRFVREAKSASALNHPNIITIHEIGEAGGTHFIATEFIDGKTLNDYKKTNPLNLKSVLEIAIQIASALDEAHSAGIVHRDVKPDNVMIRANGLVKILDFGIAKLSEISPAVNVSSEDATAIKAQSTSPGMIIGTANYMSPEQAAGKEVDARTDIFSFGVLMYEMFAARLPFAGETPMETIAAIINKEPPPLDNAGVPPEIEMIIGKSLRKDRRERYQTIKDLLIDLKEVRQELEFQDKLEQTISPNKEPKTQMLKTAATIDERQPTAAAENRNDSLTIKKSSVGKAFVVALAILIISAIGLGYWFYAGRNTKQIESVAVMPFTNESGNPEIDYLSDGMTETLISSLSQLPNLNIKPRSVVFRYKGKEADPQTVGNDLNVQAVLNGRVASRGSDLSLFVELIDVASTKVIWSRQYNRKQNEIVSLQSEIARDVSSKLKTGITNEEEKKVTRNYTENPEAYRLYLRGRSLSSRRKSKDVRAAIEIYEQAIALDPKYALAYAGLSGAHLFMVIYGGASPLEEFPKARTAALKALELDPILPDAHTALAGVFLFQDSDFNQMERETRRALELSPNDANAHRQNGLRLAWLGRFDEALASHQQSLEIEPLSLVTVVNYAWCLFYAGRIAESDAQLKIAQEIDPSFWFNEQRMYVSSRAKGDYAAAAEHLARAHELRDEPETAKFVRASFAKGGWRGLIERALSSPEGSKMMSYDRATFAAEMGEKDKAFALLGEAYDKHDQFILFMKIDPFMNPLRDDPRFEELLKKLGFPQ